MCEIKLWPVMQINRQGDLQRVFSSIQFSSEVHRSLKRMNIEVTLIWICIHQKKQMEMYSVCVCVCVCVCVWLFIASTHLCNSHCFCVARIHHCCFLWRSVRLWAMEGSWNTVAVEKKLTKLTLSWGEKMVICVCERQIISKVKQN